MARTILNQDEIDALLSDSQEEGVLERTVGVADPASVKPFVFQPPDLVSPSHLRQFTEIHTEFCREMQSSLSLLLRTRVELQLLSVDQQDYVDLVSSLDPVTNLHMFEVSPHSGTGLLEMSMPIVFGVLDHQLGGDGNVTVPDRITTAVEGAVIEPILRLLFRILQDALGREAPVEINRLDTESNPKYAHITGQNDPVVVVRMGVQVGDYTQGRMHICYPGPLAAGMLREHQSKTTMRRASEEHSDNAENRRQLLTALLDVPMRTPVILGNVTLTAEQWIGLQTGDVLVLPRRIHEPARLDVEGQPMFYAKPGRIGNHLCVRLLHSAVNDEPAALSGLLD